MIVAGLAALFACAETPQLQVVGADDQARASAPRQPPSAHVHYDSTMELPSDAEVTEPAQPFVATPEERVLAHIHTRKGVCSGIVLSPRLVATAHQCLGGDTQGVQKVSGDSRVEIASGTLAWTNRAASYSVAPACTWDKLDLAVLVLAEPADWVKPLPSGTAPDPGAKVQALGFGRCRGEAQGIRDKAGSIVSVESDAIVIDVGLCKGDVGGFVIDGGGSFLGIVSHQDDPDPSPRHTTTIFRADTSAARALVAQAKSVADGADAAAQQPITCQ